MNIPTFFKTTKAKILFGLLFILVALRIALPYMLLHYANKTLKDGKFTGYVKPIIQGLDIVAWKGQDKQDNFFQKIWESVVGGAGEVLQNQKKDQIATKINFKGTIENPESNILEVVLIVLQNAFVEALRPAIDNQINLSKLAKTRKKVKKGFFKSLFKSDKQDKKQGKKKG